MARKRSRTLQVIHPDCAGIDIGGSKHFVAVDPQCTDQPVRSFGSFTVDLQEMGQWLHQCGVRLVAMESTGVYWIPVYDVLESMGFEVHLVNPRATKQVSGRKSDVLDCQWIQQLMSYGLLKGAFRPAEDICALRAFVRQRARLTRDQSRAIQHIQKALTEMNIQLDNVLSNVMGKTGQRILRAIVDGERDGAKLAKLRDYRVKADEQTIAHSLEGTWREEHLFALQQALERYDFFAEQIAQCHQRIVHHASALARHAPTSQHSDPLAAALHQLLGVDLTAIPTIGVETALSVASEIGPDLSRFPSMAHFCSWLHLAPGTRFSGGKPLTGRSPKIVNRLGQALRLAAATAIKSQSFIGASHRARLRRLDKGRAIKATAHQLARLIFAMLTRGQPYIEKGIAHYEAVHQDRQLRNLTRRAKHLGFDLVPLTQ